MDKICNASSQTRYPVDMSLIVNAYVVNFSKCFVKSLLCVTLHELLQDRGYTQYHFTYTKTQFSTREHYLKSGYDLSLISLFLLTC